MEKTGMHCRGLVSRRITTAVAALAIGAFAFSAIAFADGGAQTDAVGTDAPAASAAADVLTFHKQLGYDLATMAADATAALDKNATPVEKSTATLGTREFCLQCHDWDAVVNSTELAGDMTVYNKQGLYNVHDNHNGLVDCSDCHAVDGSGTSTLGCVNCHYMELPEGWVGFN